MKLYTIKSSIKSSIIFTYISVMLLSMSMICFSTKAGIETTSDTTVQDQVNNQATDLVIDQITDQESKEVDKAHLNTMVGTIVQHLNALNDIVHYVGPALEKGTIALGSVETKQQAQAWVKAMQKHISSLILLYPTQLPLDLLTVTAMVRTVQMLSYNIQQTLKQRFTQILMPSTSILRSKFSLTALEIEKRLQAQQTAVISLRTQAQELGLTKTNKFCRSLDEINQKYTIAKRLFYIGATASLITGALYLMPKDWFYSDSAPVNNNIATKRALWFLSPLKKLLGDRPSYNERKEITNKPDLKMLGHFETFWRDKHTQGLVSGLGIFGGWVLGKEIKEEWNKAKQDVKNKWDQAKGYTITQDKSTYKIYQDITLQDERTIGLEEAKQTLEEIAHYVADPEIFYGADCNPTKSILLTGPSGSGKTFLAKAFSGTINKKLQQAGKNSSFGFIEVSWNDMFVKDGLKSVIEKAKEHAPCVLFIDELHNLPLQSTGYSETLTQVLTALDGLNSNANPREEVIIVAATNRKDMLDRALLRAGRFGDVVIQCDNPNYEQRKQYFETMFRRASLDTTEFDIDLLVQHTRGCSCSDLYSIIKKARFKARTMAQGVTQQHMHDTIDAHVHRLKKDVILNAQEVKLIAAHQAGHALLHMLPETKLQNELLSVTIHGARRKELESRMWDTEKQDMIQRKSYQNNLVKYGKVITYNPTEKLLINNYADKEKLCKIKLAGALAQQILLGIEGSNYHEQDTVKALKLIKEIILKGYPEDQLSKEARNQTQRQAQELFITYKAQVTDLLMTHKQILERIAQQLQEHKLLTRKNLEDIMQTA